MAKNNWLVKQSRLQQLLGLLRTDGTWTIEQVADELKVSRRTLSRDIKLLQEQGYPVESESGKGGGIALRGRLMLEDEEILNAMVAFVIAEKVNSPLFSSLTQSLKNKFSLFLTDKQRSVINGLRNRIMIGDSASIEVKGSYHFDDFSVSDAITQGFIYKNKLAISYRSESMAVTYRIIEPQLVLYNFPVWYIVGWDDDKQAVRLFRIDRILTSEIVAEQFSLRPRKSLIAGFEEYFQAL